MVGFCLSRTGSDTSGSSPRSREPGSEHASRHGLAGFPLLGQIASLHNDGHILGAGMCQVITLQDDYAPEGLRAALKPSALGQAVRRCSSLSNLQFQPGDVLKEPDLQIPLILVCTELQKGKMRITVGDSPLQEHDRQYL